MFIQHQNLNFNRENLPYASLHSTLFHFFLQFRALELKPNLGIEAELVKVIKVLGFLKAKSLMNNIKK
jgi:hypothetical protein